MPSSQFSEDLKKAEEGPKPAGVLNVKRGDGDAQFEFLIALGGSEHSPSKIFAAVQNVADYPKSHEYVICFCPDDVSPEVGDVLPKISGTSGKTVSEFLEIVSNNLSGLCLTNIKDFKDDPHRGEKKDRLDTVKDKELMKMEIVCTSAASEEDSETAGNDEDSASASTINDYEIVEYDEDSESESEACEDDYDDDMTNDISAISISAARERLLADMQLVKEAGFEIADLQSLMDCNYNSYGYLVVSIPMSDLGILDDVMQAWKLDPNEHLTLIIHYPKGYKTYEELQNKEDQAWMNVEMRVVASENPTLTVEEANTAFIKTKTVRKQKMSETHGIHDVFNSRQLNVLLEERLLKILKFRNCGLDWTGAESLYSDLLAKNESIPPIAIPDMYFEPEVNNKFFPEIVTSDHFTSNNGTKYSFPLLAMQFVLRRFVRCCEFCLTCHRKLGPELEAIKPYFCDRELCLFQSVHLNTGSIELEIMSKPYVIDLLISLCYSSAYERQLTDFPDGLGLKVPIVISKSNTFNVSELSSAKPQYYVDFHPTNLQIKFLEFFESPEKCPVSEDSWIVIRFGNDLSAELHCRVAETTSYPIITVCPPVILPSALYLSTLDRSEWISARLMLYSVNFDALSNTKKCDVICKLLDTLPSVKEMQEYLGGDHSKELENWVERFSPAALHLLRWIIVTNRSCLMQLDGENENKAQEERLFGLKGFMQFRFAVEPTERERRFVNEVRTTTQRLNLEYPTLFAWRLAPLEEWYTILRKNTQLRTVDSDLITHYVWPMKNYITGTSETCWPKSALKIAAALALCEIVNAPREFVRSNMSQYIVSQPDWVRARYLLVNCNTLSCHIGDDRKPSVLRHQDPNRTLMGFLVPLEIPVPAVDNGPWAVPLPVREMESSADDEELESALSSAMEHMEPVNTEVFSEKPEGDDNSLL